METYDLTVQWAQRIVDRLTLKGATPNHVFHGAGYTAIRCAQGGIFLLHGSPQSTKTPLLLTTSAKIRELLDPTDEVVLVAEKSFWDQFSRDDRGEVMAGILRMSIEGGTLKTLVQTMVGTLDKIVDHAASPSVSMSMQMIRTISDILKGAHSKLPDEPERTLKDMLEEAVVRTK